VSEYPKEVQEFHDALERLPGITNACSTIVTLDGVKENEFSLLIFADMPLGAMRRTHGGLAQEALVQFEFEVAQTKAGWRSLEFMAWYVRDLSRGGEAIQMRPKALPPTTHDSVQLGKTLRFQIDLFWEKAGKDLKPILLKIGELAKSLCNTIEVYDLGLKERGDPGLA
jgi:hypothetical protein